MRYAGGQHQGKCFINGVETDGVTECDTELGFAIVRVRNEQGEAIIEGGKWKRKLLVGEVVFTLAPA